MMLNMRGIRRRAAEGMHCFALRLVLGLHGKIPGLCWGEML